MKKCKVICLALFLTIFTINSFPQGSKSLILKFDKKNITLGTSLSNFKKLFPKTKLFESNSSISIYQVTPENYNLKLYFINDELNTNNLIALEASCFSDECYFGESSYTIISDQLKKKMSIIIKGDKHEGTTLTYYHQPGYLGIDDIYVGEESGDPAFTFKLIDLNHLEQFPSWIESPVLFELLYLIYLKGYKNDYETISKVVLHQAEKQLEENPADVQSFYNQYRILIDVYEKTENYVELIRIYKKLELLYPSDKDIKSNVKKYESIVNEPNQNIDSFWLGFKSCIKSNNYNEIQKMTFFPFLNHMTYLNADEFSNFRLPDYILPLFDKVKPKKSQMSFSSGIDTKGNIVKVDFPKGSMYEVNLDGLIIYFSKVNGEYKFVAILYGE